MTNSNSESKVWLITGASSGFGRALAELAVLRGDRVVATARNTAALADLAAGAPERVLPVRLDVTRPAEIEAAVAAALARFGAIDVVVNNAGFGIVGAVEETGDAELRGAFEAMFFGAVALTRAVLPHMRTRRTGTIVQITSMGGIITAPGYGAYCAAKHALEAVSESLAAEVAPLGIRVLIVEPGAFRTQLFGAGYRAMPAIEAYAATVGPTRELGIQLHGAQVGDPARAARAILDAIAAGAPTLRLPLGGDAVDGIRAKLARIAADVDHTERVARDTAFQAEGAAPANA
ncbi:MAG TPA: oxidoreductase [Kofleriaceae bacterium]|jgi:NAD(P)-dependent dehydrogenase (short-subunit alcohol dehydrogenase family)|nr:oxidoreductase [Kofleriaceae bacterium]